jgi:hypothetical protein
MEFAIRIGLTIVLPAMRMAVVALVLAFGGAPALAQTTKAADPAPAKTSAAAKPQATTSAAPAANKPTTPKPAVQTVKTDVKATAPATAAKPAQKTAAKKAPPKPKTLNEMAVAKLISQDAADFANWIIVTIDNRDQPFAVVDKKAAQILVFGGDRKLKGTSSILTGSAKGDDSAPGVGDRELKDIPMEDRTTPAGRFLAGYGPADGGKKVLWIDYATSISIHPVLTTAAAKKEKRAQRLSSKTPDDNHITHGCINVSSAFYNSTVRPAFKKGGMFYVLPDSMPIESVFPLYHSPETGGEFAAAE